MSIITPETPVAVVKAFNDGTVQSYVGSEYDVMLALDLSTQTINLYEPTFIVDDGLGIEDMVPYAFSYNLDANDYCVYEDESGQLKLHLSSTDATYVMDANLIMLEMESQYTSFNFAQYGTTAVAPHIGVDYATDNQIATRLLNSAFARVPTFDENTMTPSQYLDNANVRIKEEAKMFLGLVSGWYFDYHNLTSRHRELSVAHLHKSNLAVGTVGQIIQWTGGVYGLTLPDNLHPCDGTTIVNASSELNGSQAPDYQGRSLVGTGSIPYNYINTSGSLTVGNVYWNNNTKRGVPYKVLSASNVPETDVYIPARSGTISGTAASNRAVGAGYKMWCFPDSVPDWYNQGADMAGSGWKYAATNGAEYTTVGTHSHTVSGSCAITSHTATAGNTYPSAVDMASPSIGVEMYIIIY